MIDEGKDKDWFSSTTIVALAIIAAVGFAAFLIWELTHNDPVVDLRVFRHRGYSMSLLTLVLAFGAFFGINVLTPLWLQNFMGYTATWSGLAVAWSGVLAVFLAPVAAVMSEKLDSRRLVFLRCGLDGRGDFLAGLRQHRHGLLERFAAAAGDGGRHALLLRAADERRARRGR